MKTHLSYILIIIILIGLLVIQQQCKQPPEPVTTHDTITIPGDPFPVMVEVGKPDPVFVDQPYFLPGNIDTLAVIMDYYSKVYYADTIKDDSSAFIAIFDTVYHNRITNRSFAFQNRRATQIINNTTILPQRTALYAGAMTSLTPEERLDIGPAVLLITKKGYGYSYAYGVNHKTHTFSFVWKISLRGQHPL